MSDYFKLKNAYGDKIEENFFMSYALRGEVLVPGTRQGIPVSHPITGPVTEPSPLNAEWRREIPFSTDGIF
jgi:hypothetical protein